MSLGVEDKLVVLGLDLNVLVVNVDEVRVLEGLGEEEALLEVVLAAAIGLGDVLDAREAGATAALLHDGLEALVSEVLPLLVAGGAVSVV